MFAELFPSLQSQEVWPAAVVCYFGGASVAGLDLPRHQHAAGRVVGPACGAGAEPGARPFDALLRPSSAAERKNAAGLVDETVRQATERRLGPGSQTIVAADSTGLNSSRCSEYFGRRSGQKKRDFPKVSQVIDTASHLTLACIGERGPGPDDCVFHDLATQAHQRRRFAALLADAGYDAEHHHTFLSQKLGVLSVIPPNRGRPSHDANRQPGGWWRSFLHRHWPKKLYGQRWQIETRFSMEKRKLGPSLRSRRVDMQDAEMTLRVITLNMMLEAG